MNHIGITETASTQGGLNGTYSPGSIFGRDASGATAFYQDLDSRDSSTSTAGPQASLGAPGTYTFQFTNVINTTICGIGPPSVSTSVTVYAADPVNDDCNTRVGKGAGVASRAALMAETDWSLPGPIPITFTRYHNSLTAKTLSRSFGPTWGQTFDTLVTSFPGSAYKVTEPDGSIKYYRDVNGDGTYEAFMPVGERSSLLRTADGGFTRQFQDGTVETFNAAGYLTVIADRNGNSVGLARDATNRLTTITPPSGATVLLQYDPSNRVSAIVLPDGTHLTYTYATNVLQKVSYADGTSKTYEYLGTSLYRVKDENGHYVRVYSYDSNGVASVSADGAQEKVSIVPLDATRSNVTDSLGRLTTYAIDRTGGRNHALSISGSGCSTCGGAGTTYMYDANLRVTFEADANGNVTAYTYDSAGNILTMTEGYGTAVERTTTYTYNSLGQVLTTGQPDGGVVANTYDSRGNVLSVTDGEGNITSFTYDAKGLLTSSTDPRGFTTTYEHDAFGNLVRVVDPLEHVTEYTYDALAHVLSMTSGGATTSYEYDLRGRLKKVIAPDGGITAYEHDLAGNVTAVVDPLGNRTVSTYDGINRLIKVTDPAGNTTSYAYDTESNLTSTTLKNAVGVVTSSTTFTYDQGNRVARTTHPPDGTYSEQTYDPAGNVLTRRDENGNVYTYAYDALNRVVSVSDPIGAVTWSSYAANGLLSSVTAANGTTISYTYRRDGRVASVVSSDTGITTFTYDADGNRATETDPQGVMVIHEYDAVNRMTRSRFADPSLDVLYSYDTCPNGIGRLCSMTDQSGATVYEYDVVGRKTKDTKVVGALTLVTQYSYDLAGNPASITYPSGRVISYGYSNRRLTTVQNNASILASSVAYMPFGPVKSLTLGNGLVESYGYDQRYNLTSVASGSVRDLRYGHDAAGYLTAITDNTNSANSKSFGYDALGRLISAIGPWGSLAYTYDPAGNRLTETTSTGTTSYTYSGNRLSSTSGEKSLAFTYDLAGRPVSMNSVQFVFNQAGRLSRVLEGGSVLGDYVLDGSGRRAMKATATGTVWFIHDGDGRILGEYTPEGTPTAEYIYAAGLPLAKLEGGAAYYYHNDQVGTPQKMTSASGQVVWARDMLPFGETYSLTGAVVNNLRFPGQYDDQESGLYQNWFREYDPALGRYLSPDPLITHLDPDAFKRMAPRSDTSGRGLETYAYAGGNPLRYTDPWGLYGTNDCSYYTQRCRESGGKYYCEEAPYWCNKFPKYADPDPNRDDDYEGWARCARQCLQDCDRDQNRSQNACPLTPDNRKGPFDPRSQSFRCHAKCYSWCAAWGAQQRPALPTGPYRGWP